MGDFQTQVNVQPAPAVAGDFASANPRNSVLAGPGALVAGDPGVTIGYFAWADANGAVLNNGYGIPTGFMNRQSNMAVITTWLSSHTNRVPRGLGITLHAAGD